MLAATAAVLALSVSFWYPGCVAAPLSSEEIITQIQSLALLHRENSTLTLNTYLQYQGPPFSMSGFSFPYWLEKGLPTAALGYRTWRCLCPGERLLQARDAFSAISEFFQLALDDQNSLNPAAADLLRLLEVARRASEALLRNLKDALIILGYQPSSAQQEPLSWAQTDDHAFNKKVRGYVLCREFRDWLTRLPEDMKILRVTLRLKDSSGQEKKDCCRS
ncbi:PREDICTED: cardiotrophin-2-like [Nanorana parkeri]|uniref:cardiotrophin-2-like n=1 Tax=Nanorana parkeri TaxID=125878 RepID=UPI0008550706|nr:PREDICTED: cardiotrophin-2-like [Nanorana parkeri]